MNTSSAHATPPRGSHLRLSYLYGGIAVYRPGESLAPRVLKDYELVLIQEGQPRYHLQGQAHALRPGSTVLARPGFHESYDWDRRTRTRHAYFHFGVEALPRDWPAPARWPVVRPATSPALAALFDEILARAHRHPDWPSRHPPLADTRLVEALITLFLDPAAHEAELVGQERPEPVLRALKWMREVIDEAPERTIRLADLARAGGVTPKHLCRVFDGAIGHSPMETYRLLRLQLAVALLARSNLRVQEIAQRCGFEDALYFSRCFAAAFGLSPRATRERMRKGRPPPANPLPPDLMPRLHW
jgi:AraC family transcriptional regulator of arabinose operon